MKLASKLVRLKEAINFIASHDDAPIGEVESALKKGRAHIDSELKAAKARRKRHVKP